MWVALYTRRSYLRLDKLRSIELDKTHPLVFVVSDPDCSSTCGLKPLLKRHDHVDVVMNLILIRYRSKTCSSGLNM